MGGCLINPVYYVNLIPDLAMQGAGGRPAFGRGGGGYGAAPSGSGFP